MASLGGLTPAATIGIGAGVGGLLLLAAAAILYRIYVKRREFHAAVAEIEEGLGRIRFSEHEVSEVPRPISALRRSVPSPLMPSGAWDALYSEESLQQPARAKLATKRLSFAPDAPESKSGKRRSPKRSRMSRNFSLKQAYHRHLSAILESPRSLRKTPTASPKFEMLHPPPAEDVHAKNQGATIRQIGIIPDETSPERQEGRSPANPSIFGHPPAFLALTTDNSAPNDAESERPKTVRSKSIGSLTTGAVTAGAPPRPDRPTLHNRSVSFGAQVAGPPPTGPLPPLPSNPFWTGTSVAGTRPSGIFKPYVPAAIAAEDTSPHESTTITPNYGKIPEGWETVVKETVDRSTTITKEPTKDSSRSMKEGPTTKQPTPIMHHSSVRSTTARFSMGSNTSNRLSNSSIASSIAETANAHRLSIPQIQTADRVSISRVSSDETLRSIGSVQLLSTPKRRTMSRVSALGSPQERRRALRTVSGNAITPSRQASNATQASSTRSSNGNPFQWDTPLQPGKPSALKGSPTARSSKGHKRQNCVRISTLAPTILGPNPYSRPTSPSIMDGILEESPEGVTPHESISSQLAKAPEAPRSRSVSHFSLDFRLNPTKLRASLTPSSPTLSLRNFYHDHGSSTNTLSSRSASSPTYRAGNLSRDSSLLSIPSLPNLEKSDEITRDVTPIVSITRPSTELNESSSPPFALRVSPSESIISFGSMQEGADPSWTVLPLDIKKNGAKEYDPTSPPVEYPTPETSSPGFPFAMDGTCSDPINAACFVASPRQTRLRKQQKPPSPPCSPKSAPTDFHSSPPATILLSPSTAVQDHIPTAPLSSPPHPSPTTTLFPTHAIPPPLRPAPRPPTLQVHIRGPRTEPARDLRKNVMALRRMNSEIACGDASPELDDTVGARRYLKLGREASPLLPFTCFVGGMGRMGEEGDAEQSGKGGGVGRGQSGAGLDFGFGGDFGMRGREGDGDGEHSGKEDVDPSKTDFTFRHRASDAMEKGQSRLSFALSFSPTPTPIPISVSPFSPSRPKRPERRVSTVWEDGEKFWDLNAVSVSVPVSGLVDGQGQDQGQGQPHLGPKPPNNRVASLRDGVVFKAGGGAGKTTPETPKVRVMGPDVVGMGMGMGMGIGSQRRSFVGGTPRSLYDADGFLRT